LKVEEAPHGPRKKKAKKLEKDHSMYSRAMNLASRLPFVMALAMKDNRNHTSMKKHLLPTPKALNGLCLLGKMMLFLCTHCLGADSYVRVRDVKEIMNRVCLCLSLQTFESDD
jgi:hypothetical protein